MNTDPVPQPYIHVPILVDHNPQNVIGRVYVEKGGLYVEFANGINVTQQMAAHIFHGFGLLVTRTRRGLKGQIFLEKAQIMEFSLTLVTPEAAQDK